MQKRTNIDDPREKKKINYSTIINFNRKRQDQTYLHKLKKSIYISIICTTGTAFFS